MKKILSILMALLLFLSAFTSVSAYGLAETQMEATYTEKYKWLSDSIESLITTIENRYGKVYDFGLFDFNVNRAIENEDSIELDVDIVTDMTLIQHPLESPFISVFLKRIDQIHDINDRKTLMEYIDEYISEIYLYYYRVPSRSCFKYTVRYNEKTHETNLFYRVDVAENERILEPVDFEIIAGTDLERYKKSVDEVITALLSKENGNEKGTNQVTTITYYRLIARNYAIAHGTDYPEFNSNNGGSDCANFVSKSLNAGGFPVDYSGNWYPSSDGTTNTCGYNWMRTGYYNNGGVVPYMTSKNYFYYQSNESAVYAGSIMYWNSTSHVALVTYGDTVTIKYTQHSNYQMNYSQSTNVVYESENASFYMPNTYYVNVDSVTQ